MAIEGLKWVMELMDRTSGPARKVVQSLNAVRVAQDSVRASASRAARAPDPLAALDRATGQRRTQRQRTLGRELEAFARSQQRTSDWSSTLNGVLSTGVAVLGAIGAAAIGAASAIAGVGGAAARSVVELSGFQESTMVAMQTMLGSRGAANAEFGSALRIARLTPFDTRNVVSLRRQLLGAGFRDGRERDVMTAIISDVSAMNPEDSGVMQRLGLAIGQIRGAGRLRGQELNQLQQAGFGQEHFFAAIGEQLNLRGTTAGVNRQIRAMMEAGRITDRIAFAAMARAITRMTGTERAGQYSTNQSTTILGLLSTLGSAVPELLLSDGPGGKSLFESDGMKAFKTFLKTIIDLLSSTSATGQRLQRIMRGLIDDVFGVFGGINEIQGTKAQKGPELVFEVMLDRIELVIGAIRTLVKWTSELGGGFFAVIGPTLDGIATAAGWVIDTLGGDGAETALWVMKAIGVALGVVVVALYALVALVALPFVIAGVAIYGVIRAIEWLIEKLSAIQAPEWLKELLGVGDAPAPALAGATNIVNAGRDPSVGRPIVSQPNVTVNVNAQAEKGSTPEDIAAAAGAAIPTVVQDSAGRASRGTGG